MTRIGPSLALVALAATGFSSSAQEPLAIAARRIDVRPKIDGRLDEPFWSTLTPIALRLTVEPAENQPATSATECYIAYDSDRLYVAFRAHEPIAGSVRAHLSDRDQIVRDDQVGIVLDPFNDGRRGFAFITNPLGVQFDMTVNGLGAPRFGSFAFSGASFEDWSWDAIWSSAGQVTADGFTVEFEIPFSSLRFPNQSGVQSWGIFPLRARPRDVRERFAAVPIDRSRNCFLCQSAQLSGLEGIKPGRDLEFDPTVVVTGSELTGVTPDGTSRLRSSKGEAGLTFRWGITPNMALGAILNPDFSQVEADEPQLNVNTRFALFFAEKRPFFLEGADLFNTLSRAVYSRTVVNPDFGIKLAGKQGANALGLFVARDADTTLLFPSNQGSQSTRLAQPNTTAVLRWRRDLGPQSSIGLLATGRDGADYSNFLGGLDGRIGLSDSDSIELQQLISRTEYPLAVADEFLQPHGSFSGSSSTLQFEHNTHDWQIQAVGRRLSPGFRADSGFIPQVDLRDVEANIGRVWLGGEDSFWNRQKWGVAPFHGSNDRNDLSEEGLQIYGELSGKLQTFLRVTADRSKALFSARYFNQDKLSAFFNIRPSGTFTSSIQLDYGHTIDFAGARRAERLFVRPEFTWNIGRHFFLGSEDHWERLDVDQGRLYTVNQLSSRIVYQFNTRSFLRAIWQRTTVDREPEQFPFPVPKRSDDRFLQLLFSYKLNPLTVIYAGYTDCRDCAQLPSSTDPNFSPEKLRTLFLKLGYAYLP